MFTRARLTAILNAPLLVQTISPYLSNQSDVKLILITTWSLTFSRTERLSDWLSIEKQKPKKSQRPIMTKVYIIIISQWALKVKTGIPP